MKRLLPLSALLLLPGCNRGHEAPSVAQAWVRLPAVPGQPAAAYFTLQGGAAAERLVKVETTLAKKAELHESMAGHAGMGGMGTMATMAPLAAVDLPARGAVAFAPGGKHVMIYGLDAVVTPGTAVPLRFGFASGKTAEAEAKSVAAGEGAPY